MGGKKNSFAEGEKSMSTNQVSPVTQMHDRAGVSAGEYRKTLISLSTGSLAVFFLALTTKIDPGLSGAQKVLLMIALSAMSLSVLLGVAAWYADAQWAYAKGEKINPTPKKVKNWQCEIDKWHGRKSRCDFVIPLSFVCGIIAATLYVVSRVIS
jgi:hypothetical protein